jgi:hypothetical protein
MSLGRDARRRHGAVDGEPTMARVGARLLKETHEGIMHMSGKALRMALPQSGGATRGGTRSSAVTLFRRGQEAGRPVMDHVSKRRS